ncbi:stanniocalcin-2-like protein [Cricetulus griseus]|nr:stanniocalcin-2-like protein [Cricetulus griseus]
MPPPPLFLLPGRVNAAAVACVRSLPEPKNACQGRPTEIQHCLVNAGDVGCGVFECFENNSCEIRGLHGICMTFLHNAGKFDAQGKSFIKDALRCKAHALRHRFGCISRKCPAIKEMVFQLQRECYLKHDLCSAAQGNIGVIVEMINFRDLLLHEPYVDLVNLLLTCGEDVKEAVTRSIQAQCEQNWGGLCSILSFCTSNIQRPPTAVPERQPLADRAQLSRPQHRDTGHHLSEAIRGAKGERGSKSHPSVHARSGAGGQSAQGPSGSSEWEDEQTEYSDIRSAALARAIKPTSLPAGQKTKEEARKREDAHELSQVFHGRVVINVLSAVDLHAALPGKMSALVQ